MQTPIRLNPMLLENISVSSYLAAGYSSASFYKRFPDKHLEKNPE